ncbi:MAG: hypothetical protein KUL75_05590 [Sterolibacterium sp.]|nr:hypothetical protein [Sterolibacterium sp.]
MTDELPAAAETDAPAPLDAEAFEQIAEQLRPQTLNFLAWSALWSTLTEDELRAAAWEALELPGDFEAIRISYWNTFQVGIPQPPIPALIHALMNIDGAGAREDFMRAADHLGLSWGHARLSPDQLGPACEIFAMAVEQEEPVIIAHLSKTYLLPWLDLAQEQLNASANPELAQMLALFREHINEAIRLIPVVG